ncbi:MAG: hypothetical protein Q8K63_06735 [Acidimicrobiales bacterium]|nr:hypothetical protein [Acidimicrobiales bacterium]
MRSWSNRIRRVPPPNADAALWELAHDNASGRYTGPAVDEPYVHQQLRRLGADLRRVFTTDTDLRAAQHLVTSAQSGVERAEERRVGAHAEAAAGYDTLPDGTPATPRVSATRASRARTAARDADGALEQTQRGVVTTERALTDAEANLIGRLADAAAAGLQPIEDYITYFNAARQYEGGQLLGTLPDDFVDQLVRAAVRPIRLDYAAPE